MCARLRSRGFSTPASLLVIFMGLFLAMSTLYTVTANTAEGIDEAREASADHRRTVQGTTVEIASATWDTSASNLTIQVDNQGETALSVDAVDVVVDGRYVDSEQFDARVDGVATGIWRPGETLVLEEDGALTDRPDRVKVVTGPGVADTAEVGS